MKLRYLDPRFRSPCETPGLPSVGCPGAGCAAAKGHLECLQFWTEVDAQMPHHAEARQRLTAYCEPSTSHHSATDLLGDATVAGLAASYGHFACLEYALGAGYTLNRSLINFCARKTVPNLPEMARCMLYVAERGIILSRAEWRSSPGRFACALLKERRDAFRLLFAKARFVVEQSRDASALQCAMSRTPLEVIDRIVTMAHLGPPGVC